MIPLFPLVLLIQWIRGNYKNRKIFLNHCFVMLSTLITLLLAYFLAWYLPNKEAYDYMIAHQSGEFTFSGKIWEYIRFNLDYHFLKGWLQWFVYIFLALLVVGFVMLKHTKSNRYPVMYFSSLVWFLLELHKLMMVYLPTRYQVSLFASMGLLISVVSYELLISPPARIRVFARIITIVLLFTMTTINIYNYIDTFRHRTFVIRETNEYLARNLTQNDLVIGAWAPSLTWGTRAKAIPVWNNFLNYQDPVNKFHPKAVIAETDEQDSEQAWSSQGINLPELSDSTRTVRIGQWEIRIYWMKTEN